MTAPTEDQRRHGTRHPVDISTTDVDPSKATHHKKCHGTITNITEIFDRLKREYLQVEGYAAPGMGTGRRPLAINRRDFRMWYGTGASVKMPFKFA
ncbi:MAG: hypothetical protein K6T59_16165 [Bryobacteraceae bacterium]|jgi:hypothetical protein|nr:hypothetical protein [Bryobacteraceae bacterium]